jgi:lipoprotein-anchoring transpeptidase ErfK/SrfK
MLKNLIWWHLALKITLAMFVLAPAESSAWFEGENHYEISIKLSEKKLFLLKNDIEIVSYSVAIPKSVFYKLPAEGELIRIEINPVWYPTEKTRAAYLKTKKMELPKVVSPKDPRNAMGAVKLIIRFNEIKEPIRIHGTNEPSSIGKRITRGCFRLHNKDALNLVDIIKNQKVKVRIKN